MGVRSGLATRLIHGKVCVPRRATPSFGGEEIDQQAPLARKLC